MLQLQRCVDKRCGLSIARNRVGTTRSIPTRLRFGLSWFVCQQDNQTKVSINLEENFLEVLKCATRNKRLDFGSYTDHDADPGIVEGIFTITKWKIIWRMGCMTSSEPFDFSVCMWNCDIPWQCVLYLYVNALDYVSCKAIYKSTLGPPTFTFTVCLALRVKCLYLALSLRVCKYTPVCMYHTAGASSCCGVAR